MNKFTKWHYDRNKVRLLQEVQDYGLRIIDEDRFHKHVLDVAKKNVINTILFSVIIIAIIIKWVM